MKALKLENVSKSYKVVKKLSDKSENHLLGTRNLTRFFLGETFSVLGTRIVTTITALDRVSFSIEPGQVVGLFGKNGSGKTTLLSILGGVFPPDSGTICCFGYDMHTNLYQARKYIIPVFGWLNATTLAFTGRQNIEKFLIMHHVDPAPLANQIDELAHEIELGDRLDDRAARYSQGMRVKIQVIAAILLHRAQGHSLLLLDEPFIGLDVFTQRYLREFVKYKMRGENFSMILATHQPEDIEEICDEVILLDEGRIIAKDNTSNLRKLVQQKETIQINYLTLEGQPLVDQFFQRDGILDQKTLCRGNQVTLSLSVEDSQATLSWLVGAMVQAGFRLTSLHTHPMKFEDVLMQLIIRDTKPDRQSVSPPGLSDEK